MAILLALESDPDVLLLEEQSGGLLLEESVETILPVITAVNIISQKTETVNIPDITSSINLISQKTETIPVEDGS